MVYESSHLPILKWQLQTHLCVSVCVYVWKGERES